MPSCLAGAGSFSFFGNRTRRLLRVFMDHLAAYARQRLTEEGIHVRVTDLLEGAPAPVTEALAYILLAKLFRRPVPRHGVAASRIGVTDIV